MKRNAERSHASLVAMFMLCLIAAPTQSAELTGRISGSSATVRVVCPNYNSDIAVAAGESYTLRSLPSNSTCELTVRVGELESRVIKIQTTASLIRFNAEVRLISGEVIVLRR